MRRRKWVIFVAFGGVLLVLGVYVGWRATKANDKIRQMLLDQVRPFLAQESNVENVEVDLNSIHLKSVRLAPKDRSFTLEIDDVRIGYRFWSLLRYRFAPNKIAHDVVFVHPTVIIRKIASKVNGELNSEEGLNFRRWVDEIETVKRITLAEAEVFIEDSSGVRVRLAHSLNGWLKSISADSSEIRLSGKVFESEKNNLTIEGQLDLFSGRPINMHIQLDESEPSDELPFILPDYVHVSSGKMKGEVNLHSNEPSSGFLEIKEGSFSFNKTNLSFIDVNMKGVIEGKDMLLDGTVNHFQGSPLTISGSISNMLDPQLDISIHSSQLNTEEFLQTIVPDIEWPLSGDAQVDCHVTGSLNNSTMIADLSCLKLNIYGLGFNRFTTHVRVRNNIFDIEGDAKQEDGISLDFNGTIDFSNVRQPTFLAIQTEGNLLPNLPSWIQKNVSICKGELSVQLDGELRNLSGSAQGKVLVYSESIDTLQLLPHFQYANQELSIQVHSNQEFGLDGLIRSPFHDSTTIKIEADGLAVILKPFLKEQERRNMDGIHITSTFSGSNGKWEITSTGLDDQRELFPKIFDLRMIPLDQRMGNEKVSLQGTCYGPEGHALSLSAEGKLDKSAITLDRCEIGDFILVEGIYPFDAEGPLQGQVIFNNFSFEKLHNVFPGIRSYSGELRGEVRVTGSKSQPTVDLDLALVKGQFHDIGVFEGELKSLWEKHKLQLCDLSFRKDGFPLITGKIEDTGIDSLSGEFVGNSIDVGSLIQGLTGRTLITGKGSTKIRVEGRGEAPIFHGVAEMNDGSVGPISYRKLRIEAEDTLVDYRGIFSRALTVQNGFMERDDGLQLHFWGDFPYLKSGDMDISILAQGNVLGFLPELSGLFQKAEGSGEVQLRLAGGFDDWALGSGSITLNEGEIELSSFVKKIENIQIQADLEQEERFINIKNISGMVGGEQLFINNRLAEAGPNRLSPLVWDKIGVQFGVLQFVTEGKGIRAHLPGLMEEGEEGWIAFEKQDPEKTFIIAGPNEFPLFRGTLILTDNRLTYPFLSIGSEHRENQMIDFLRKVNWDIRILPKEDVHFQRDIESALGNVYTDLKLQDQYGELCLSGIIQEGNFQVWGDLVSTDGSVEVLDHFFQPERITLNYPKGAENPIISGRIYTTVVDSMGMSSTIWLTVTSLDDATGLEKEEGAWNQIQFKLSTNNPNLGRSEADLLSALGYSTVDFKDRAYDALGMRVENLVFRPLFKPLEREIRHYLGLDIVRLSSMFSRNIVQLQTMDNVEFDPKFLLRSAKLTLGKSIAPGLFLIYSGQIQNGIWVQYLTHGLGFRHVLTLEYTIRPDLYLQMEYTYNNQLLSDRREDKRIWIRHILSL